MEPGDIAALCTLEWHRAGLGRAAADADDRARECDIRRQRAERDRADYGGRLKFQAAGLAPEERADVATRLRAAEAASADAEAKGAATEAERDAARDAATALAAAFEERLSATRTALGPLLLSQLRPDANAGANAAAPVTRGGDATPRSGADAAEIASESAKLARLAAPPRLASWRDGVLRIVAELSELGASTGLVVHDGRAEDAPYFATWDSRLAAAAVVARDRVADAHRGLCAALNAVAATFPALAADAPSWDGVVASADRALNEEARRPVRRALERYARCFEGKEATELFSVNLKLGTSCRLAFAPTTSETPKLVLDALRRMVTTVAPATRLAHVISAPARVLPGTPATPAEESLADPAIVAALASIEKSMRGFDEASVAFANGAEDRLSLLWSPEGTRASAADVRAVLDDAEFRWPARGRLCGAVQVNAFQLVDAAVGLGAALLQRAKAAQLAAATSPAAAQRALEEGAAAASLAACEPLPLPSLPSAGTAQRTAAVLAAAAKALAFVPRGAGPEPPAVPASSVVVASPAGTGNAASPAAVFTAAAAATVAAQPEASTAAAASSQRQTSPRPQSTPVNGTRTAPFPTAGGTVAAPAALTPNRHPPAQQPAATTTTSSSDAGLVARRASKESTGTATADGAPQPLSARRLSAKRNAWETPTKESEGASNADNEGATNGPDASVLAFSASALRAERAAAVAAGTSGAPGTPSGSSGSPYRLRSGASPLNSSNNDGASPDDTAPNASSAAASYAGRVAQRERESLEKLKQLRAQEAERRRIAEEDAELGVDGYLKRTAQAQAAQAQGAAHASGRSPSNSSAGGSPVGGAAPKPGTAGSNGTPIAATPPAAATTQPKAPSTPTVVGTPTTVAPSVMPAMARPVPTAATTTTPAATATPVLGPAMMEAQRAAEAARRERLLEERMTEEFARREAAEREQRRKAQETRDAKEAKEAREAKEAKAALEAKEAARAAKEAHAARAALEALEAKEAKEAKAAKEASERDAQRTFAAAAAATARERDGRDAAAAEAALRRTQSAATAVFGATPPAGQPPVAPRRDSSSTPPTPPTAPVAAKVAPRTGSAANANAHANANANDDERALLARLEELNELERRTRGEVDRLEQERAESERRVQKLADESSALRRKLQLPPVHGPGPRRPSGDGPPPTAWGATSPGAPSSSSASSSSSVPPLHPLGAHPLAALASDGGVPPPSTAAATGTRVATAPAGPSALSGGLGNTSAAGGGGTGAASTALSTPRPGSARRLVGLGAGSAGAAAATAAGNSPMPPASGTPAFTGSPPPLRQAAPATTAAAAPSGASASLLEEYRGCCAANHVKPNSGLLKRLPKAVDEVVTEINLDLNYIGVKGVIPVIHVIRRNRGLRLLNLKDNNLENAEVKALVEALLTESGAELAHLDLSNNPISLAGGSALLDLVTRQRSLTTVVLRGTLIQPKVVERILEVAAANRAAAGTR